MAQARSKVLKTRKEKTLERAGESDREPTVAEKLAEAFTAIGRGAKPDSALSLFAGLCQLTDLLSKKPEKFLGRERVREWLSRIPTGFSLEIVAEEVVEIKAVVRSNFVVSSGFGRRKVKGELRITTDGHGKVVAVKISPPAGKIDTDSYSIPQQEADPAKNDQIF